MQINDCKMSRRSFFLTTGGALACITGAIPAGVGYRLRILDENGKPYKPESKRTPEESVAIAARQKTGEAIEASASIPIIGGGAAVCTGIVVMCADAEPEYKEKRRK